MKGVASAYCVLLAMASAFIGCGDTGPEPLVFCQSRGDEEIPRANGLVNLQMTGPQQRAIAEWEVFVTQASSQLFSLEICSVITEVDPDWHLVGTWHLEGEAPWSISTFPPGSYFEGQLKGEANPGIPIIRSFFESVPYESLAPEGHGEITAYDPFAGAVRGELEIVSHGTFSNDSSRMALQFDLSWEPSP
jgi:hypothetical protein